jgi:hypothetical protein
MTDLKNFNPSPAFDKNREEMKTNGWTILKGVFSQEEVAEFRKMAYKSGEEGLLKCDLLSISYFQHVVYDKRIIAFVSEILGGQPVYFGESRCLVERFNGRKSGGYHKDNPDRINPDGPDWKSPYKVVRIGIYLQDHKDHSGGLGLKNGSHKDPVAPFGKIIGNFTNAPTQPGDVLIWYLTTSHVGYVKLVEIFSTRLPMAKKKGMFINNQLYDRIPSMFVKPIHQERIVLHCCYGLENSPHLDRYIEYCKHRTYAVNGWKNIRYSSDVLERAARNNLIVRDMSKELEEIDMTKVGAHLELPF